QPMGTVAPPLEEQAGGRELTVMAPLEGGPARPEREVNLRPQLRPSQVETAVWAPPVVEAEPVDGVPQETVQVPLEPRSGRTEPMPAVNDMPSSEFVVPAPAPMPVPQPPTHSQGGASYSLPSYTTKQAAQLLKQLPGTRHYKGVIPDSFPATKGWIHLSDAQRLIHVYQHMSATPTGQA